MRRTGYCAFGRDDTPMRLFREGCHLVIVEAEQGDFALQKAIEIGTFGPDSALVIETLDHLGIDYMKRIADVLKTGAIIEVLGVKIEGGMFQGPYTITRELFIRVSEDLGRARKSKDLDEWGFACGLQYAEDCADAHRARER